MNTGDIERDERTVAVENAGYRWSYLVLSFGLLGLTAYRSWVRGEAVWDLLALVVIGGGVNAVYQGTRRVLNERWLVVTIVTFAIAALVAVGIIAVKSSR
jgi:hypothetical protein